MNTCPYCLSSISDSEQSIACETCGAKYHVECWRESGGCAVRNCRDRARSKPIEIEIDAEPHTVLVLSKESVEQARPSAIRRTSNPCLRCGKQLPEGELYCVDCAPTLGENEDTRNVGPLLVMLGIGALLIFWLWWVSVGPRPIGSPDHANNQHASQTLH